MSGIYFVEMLSKLPSCKSNLGPQAGMTFKDSTLKVH